MAVATQTLYDTDFVEWAERTATLLREHRFEEADIDHAAEEIEDLGKSERSAIASHLSRMLMHLIKQRIQPERDGSSWRHSITDARREILSRLRTSPSLRRFAEEILAITYKDAVSDALFETGLASRRASLNIPDRCPYTLEDLLESDQLDPQK